MEQWIINLEEAFQEFWQGLASFVPQLVVAILILFVGWLIALAAGRIVDYIIKMLKVDDALRQAGLESIVYRGGLTLNAGHFFGTLVKWFILIGFIVIALNFLDFDALNQFFLEDLLSFIPQVIMATLVLVVAAIFGDVLHRTISTSMKMAGWVSAELVGQVVKWTIWIFAVLVALDHLKIIPEAFINTLLQGIVIAMALGFGLSFGLGGKKVAEEYIEKMRDRIVEREDR